MFLHERLHRFPQRRTRVLSSHAGLYLGASAVGKRMMISVILTFALLCYLGGPREAKAQGIPVYD